jgi:hypothetical protein
MMEVVPAEPAERIFFLHPAAGDPRLRNPQSRFVGGAQTSTLQAATRLQRAGFDCRIVDTFGEAGIYFAHPDVLRGRKVPRSGVFLVSIRNDRRESTLAHCEVVQNPLAERPDGHRPAFYIPYYPQADLQKRDHRRRGTVFRSIRYFGRRENLHPELLSVGFRRWLEAHDLEFKAEFAPGRWGDYSGVDVVLAARDFHLPWPGKPANKLVNAWRAEVPALLGPESSFRWYRRSWLDYIEVRSMDDVRRSLLLLKQRPDLVSRIRRNCRQRQGDVTFDGVTRAWAETIEHRIKPLARRWFAQG